MWNSDKGRKSEAQSLDDLEKGSKDKARDETRLNGKQFKGGRGIGMGIAFIFGEPP